MEGMFRNTDEIDRKQLKSLVFVQHKDLKVQLKTPLTVTCNLHYNVEVLFHLSYSRS